MLEIITELIIEPEFHAIVIISTPHGSRWSLESLDYKK